MEIETCAQALCMLVVVVLTFYNLYFTSKVARTTGEALRHTKEALDLSRKSLERLNERQDALHCLNRLVRGDLQMAVASIQARMRRVCYKLTGAHALGEECFPVEKPEKPISIEDINETIDTLKKLAEKTDAEK